MKIASSSIAMAAQSQSSASLTQITAHRTENARTGAVNTIVQAAQLSASSSTQSCLVAENGATVCGSSTASPAGDAATLQLSEAAQNAAAAADGAASEAAAATVDSSGKGSGNLLSAMAAAAKSAQTQGFGVQLTSEQELKLNMIQNIMQSLHNGKRMKMVGLNDLGRSSLLLNAFGGNVSDRISGQVFSRLGQQTASLQDVFQYTPPMAVVTDATSTTYQEQQSMDFSAVGNIQTADGKSISVNISLSMSREFYTQNTSVEQTVQALKDPLVLNFKGGAAELTDEKFSFDLDCDGSMDQMSFVSPDSGLLALDRNGDGKVNDGSELFGTRSGDGFADLANYDDDANGWIDENDEIYDKLRIWTKDSDGNDQLLALGVKGVGAIYLGNVSTDFALKDDANATNGAIRSSGVYLNEDGTSGTIQHVDFAI
jgi:hypothetical protein